MGIAGKVDNEGAFELSEGTIETFGQGLSKVTKIYSALSSVAGGSRRFFRGVLFSFAAIMLMQFTGGCTVQFTPGDGICGNGDMEGDEMCDGSDFGGKTCADWSSYEHGELVCTEDCKVDFTMCHTCGDGRLEGPEDCDGDNLNGETCESLGGQPGGELSCRADCSFDLTGCGGLCGNGVREEGEACDGEELGGATCESLGFEIGELSCSSNCEYETSGCGASECGNGVKEEEEECDGGDLGGTTCEDLGLGTGTLSCADNCTYDTQGCETVPFCGNNNKEMGEECDGDDLGGETCDSLGLGTGTLICEDNCTYNTQDCETGPICGNNNKEMGEECDGSDLNGETCETQGYYEGDLFCDSGCVFDISECSGYCGDGVINGFEVCDGSNLGAETCVSLGFYGDELGCLNDCSGFDTSGCSTAPPFTWVTIYGGTFDMGSNDGVDAEQPVHSVTVHDFEMTQTEVTVAQYEECVTAGVCTAPSTIYSKCNWDDPGYEDHPVNCVTWYKARDFCEWAGGRLPSEAEWEYAARSGGQNRTYPWGSNAATCDRAVMKAGGNGCGTDRTWSVCSKVAGNTDQGLCDMGGNVSEWVEDDWHESYDDAPEDESPWVDDPRGSNRVIRGGGLDDMGFALRASYRIYGDPSAYYYSFGFRCSR